MGKTFAALGFMSGTSLDGMDLALLMTDGTTVSRTNKTLFVPYSETFRQQLIQAKTLAHEIFDALASKDAAAFFAHRHRFAAVEAQIAKQHVSAYERFLTTHGLAPEDIDLLGFHGQTLLHRPEAGLSFQAGDAARLAQETGRPVVADFRQADLAAGGQGAPLVPVYHQALARSLDIPPPVAFVNLGGVANVTWLDEDADPIAFDAGPGNALLDDWVREKTGAPYDKDGALAQKGRLSEAVLSRLLAHPFFSQDPPKSLDRDDFSLAPLAHLSPEGGAATLVAFTALAVARADFFFPLPPKTWVVSGGGVHNPALMAALRRYLSGTVTVAEDWGLSSDFLEAEAFAFLAVRCLGKLPLTFPTTTGAPSPLTGGKIFSPSKDS